MKLIRKFWLAGTHEETVPMIMEENKTYSREANNSVNVSSLRVNEGGYENPIVTEEGGIPSTGRREGASYCRNQLEHSSVKLNLPPGTNGKFLNMSPVNPQPTSARRKNESEKLIYNSKSYLNVGYAFKTSDLREEQRRAIKLRHFVHNEELSVCDTEECVTAEIFEKKDFSEEPFPVEEASKAYKACSNLTLWTERGTGPLLALFLSYGGFPMINDSWQEDDFDWLEKVAIFRRHFATTFLINFSVELNKKNSSSFVINLVPGSLPVPLSTFLSNDSQSQEYKENYVGFIASLILTLLQESNPQLIFPTDNSTESGNTVTSRKPTIEEQTSLSKTNLLTIKELPKILNKNTKQLVTDNLQLIDNIENIWTFYVDLAKIQTKTMKSNESYNLISITELQSSVPLSFSNTKESLNALLRVMKDLSGDTILIFRQVFSFCAFGVWFVALQWLHYINSVLSDSGIQLNEEDKIYVENIHYLQQLSELINRTSESTVANAMAMEILVGLGEDLSPTMRKLVANAKEKLQLQALKFGPSTTRMWNFCASRMNFLFGPVVSKLFIQYGYNYSPRSDISLVIEGIRKSFAYYLVNSSWMDNSTLSSALKKLENIFPLIAYPDIGQENKKILEYFKGMPLINKTEHFSNIINMYHFLITKELKLLLTAYNREEWIEGVTLVNAYYGLENNVIAIPAGILQPPIYFQGVPMAYVFGGIGSVIGHEISHAFDIKGKERDWQGHLNNWWSEEAVSQYKNRTECLRKQYDAFQVDQLKGFYNGSLHINGQKTLGENTADNEGIRVSWKAYKQHIDTHPEVATLPGLSHFTYDQLFFISWAQLWCGHSTNKLLQTILEQDVHSPSRFRIIGTVQNNENFAKAFSCSKDQEMNPNEKCILW